MTTQMTAAQWAEILKVDPDPLGPYSDWLEESGLPALAAAVRQLPEMAKLMQLRLRHLCRLYPFRMPLRRLRLLSMRKAPGVWIWEGFSAFERPRSCDAVDVLIAAARHGKTSDLRPALVWFETVTGFIAGSIRGRLDGEGEAYSVEFHLPARKRKGK